MIPQPGSINSEAVIALCKKLVSDPHPLYLKVKPNDDAIVGECTKNVEKMVSLKGGTIHYGWQIWEMERMVEAEFHAVWVDLEGNYHDITPKGLFNITEILFLPDPSINYTGTQIDNVRIPKNENDEIIKRFIKINERYFEASNRGDLANKYGEIIATPEMIEIMRERDKICFELIQDMNKPLTIPGVVKVSRNSTCPCGSGKKYKRCHGFIV